MQAMSKPDFSYSTKRMLNHVLSRRTACGVILGLALAATGCGDEPTSPSTPSDRPSAAIAVVAALSFRQVSAGTVTTCGLTSDGLAYCWGGGQLKPVAVPGGRHFVQISAGERHNCAVTSTNEAYCWGSNSWGQLGDGTFNDHTAPTLVLGHHHFRQIRAGYLHTCGVNTSNVAFCWGNNDWGQLGTGVHGSAQIPVRVAGGLLWRQVIAGASHTCGVTQNDKGYCWGANFSGMLGDGTRIHRNKPALIAGGLAFRQVVPGAGWFPDFVEPFVDDGYSCGITTDNKAYCWGLNQGGVLGTGSTANSSTPAKVAGGRNFRFLNAGSQHVCGVVLSNAVFCWGDNSLGQLGIGSFGGTRFSPVRVPGTLTFSSVTAGTLSAHSCGWTTTDGRAYCWGSNSNGQLGDGTRTNRSSPVPVIGP
jgi:alpha-tubulin suppressor-like RCC1 family protein